MKDVVIGVRLVGGPDQLDGWANAYDADSLGGWPPPEEISAFSIGAQVVVALPENVPDKYKDMMSHYRKIAQSTVDSADKHFFRGATYEYVATDE